MEAPADKMKEFISLVDKHTPGNGIHETGVTNVITYRESKVIARYAMIYDSGVVIGAQGKKNVYLEGKRYFYGAGNYLALMLPMPVECELVEASEENPLMGIGIYLDSDRISNLLLKMDRTDPGSIKPEITDTSAIFSAPINDPLLDATIRLLKVLDTPTEAAVLGDAIVDEIYYRILTDGCGGALRYLLQQRGQIQQISRAVEYVHQNLDKVVSVDEMADIVNMSSSGFHKKFKEVMHLSPLQYAKSIKLNKAKNFIMDGKSVSEAGYMVGYNSPAQFSREYKRHFGVVPSAT